MADAKVNFYADTKEFTQSIRTANNTLTQLRSEAKLNAAQMKATGVSVEGLQTQHENLTAQVEAQRQKTEALTQKYESAVSIFGATSAEATKLATQLNTSRIAEINLQRQVEKCNEAIAAQEAAQQDNRTASEKLSDTIGDQQEELDGLKRAYVDAVLQYGEASDEARSLADRIGSLSNELKSNESRMSDAQDAANELDGSLEGVGESTEEAEGGFTILDGVISNFAANTLSSIVGKIGDAISSFANLSQETQEYREDIEKLNAAFQTAGHSTSEATEVYKELYSVFGEEDRAVEAAQQIASVAKNADEMARMTEIATGAWARWGDSLATESLMEAVNSTSKIGEVQGTLADALEWTGVNLDDFNASLGEMNTEEERSAYILDTLEGLYKTSAENYRENNEEMIKNRRAASDYNDVMADMGEAMEPLNTEIMEMKTQFARELYPVLKREIIPAFKEFFDRMKEKNVLQDVARIIGSLASGVLPVMADVVGALAQNWREIVIVVGLAVAAYKTLMVITTVTTAIKGASTAMGVLNAVMAANPIGAVVTAAVALVSAIALIVDASKNAKTSLDYMAEATDANTEANAKWRESMESASAGLGDYSSFLNAAGDSTQSLRQKMDDAQQSITDIYAAAFSENRALRADEISSIYEFNAAYVEAQDQLVALERQKIEARVTAAMWKIENLELSAEQEQGILNDLKVARDEYNAIMSEQIANELVLLEQRYSNGQISFEEYDAQKRIQLEKQAEYATTEKELTQGVTDATLQAQRDRITINAADFTEITRHYGSIEEIQAAHAEQVKKINEDETLSWWEKNVATADAQDVYMQNMWDFGNESGATWQDYRFLTDQNLQEQQAAFWNWVANTEAAGGELSAENRAIASAILSAYADLPEELEESGLESLRGMALGMADEYPALKNAAEMDAKTLIDTMNKELGVQSPSWKMRNTGQYLIDGLSGGMNGKLPSLRSVATSIGNSVLNTFRNLFKTHSPSKVTEGLGINIGEGLAIGIEDSTGGAVKAAEDQAEAVADAYSFADIETPIFGDDTAITARLQTGVSASVDQTIRESGILDIVQAVEDLADRAINLNINGKQFATATAGDYDGVSGNRLAMTKRGLAVSDT